MNTMIALTIMIHLITGIMLIAIVLLAVIVVSLFITAVCFIGGTLNKLDAQQPFFDE